MKLAMIILGLICLFLFCYLILMKREIRNISKELKANRQESYNKQIRVQLFDRDLTELTKECNYNLDYQTHCKRRAAHQEQSSKQAISDIAHDLRTPLTVVKGNLQLIKREGSLSAKEQQYLEICETKTEELKYMIDEFFELSMLESDHTNVELTSVNITSLLFQVILEHEILIREHKLTPNLDLPEKTIFVQGNSQLLERIFGNILGNIFKYAKEQFTLRLKEDEQHCVIEFSNPSSDIHNIDVVHLFDRTYMADASRQKPGTGLGLYIVKLLAEKQGAEVFAEIRKNELVIVVKLRKEESKK